MNKFISIIIVTAAISSAAFAGELEPPVPTQIAEGCPDMYDCISNGWIC